MPVKRKVQLVSLFSLSFSVIAVTLYRVPHILRANGSQPLRSVLASVELLFAATSANAIVLGSFVRDRGVKKRKFRYGSLADSIDRSSGSRRPTMHRHWGSDEDLVRDIGLGVRPDLRELPDSPTADGNPLFTPAPFASRLSDNRLSDNRLSDNMNQWQFPTRKRSNAERSDDSLLSRDNRNMTPTPRKVSFFDVGGLLEEQPSGSGGRRESTYSTLDPLSPQNMPSPSLQMAPTSGRRGSAALVQDLGGLLGPLNSKQSRSKSRTGTELQPLPNAPNRTYDPSNVRQDPVLMDAGGLLR
jgi:hypothetical protein